MNEQGTPEWHKDRLGKVTASRIADVMMAKTTAGYQNYRAQLLCERLTGEPTETFTSAAMQHGTETEPRARAFYSMEAGLEVTEAGFVDHATIKMCGASPDGFVGERGLVEFKCPQPAQHILTLTGSAIDRKYKLQMQWQMECTGREWCDFVSFCPMLPDELQIFVHRLHASDETQDEIRDAVQTFLSDLDDLQDKITTKKEAA